jgi:protein-S-isoprenylcysteine O-methyltransferase Ste14
MPRTEVLIQEGTRPRPGVSRRLGRSLARTALALAAVLVVVAQSATLGAVYHVLSRLAYVGFVGWLLRSRKGREVEPRRARERAFTQFRSVASVLMENDAFSFGALVLVTLESFDPLLPALGVRAIGLALIALGVGTKAWAARTLGAKAYYWHDFFVPPETSAGRAVGPYRWLRNPMYTVGYAHAYGVALFFLSWPGLLAALFDQAAMLAFHGLIERPHVNELYGRGVPKVDRTTGAE